MLRKYFLLIKTIIRERKKATKKNAILDEGDRGWLNYFMHIPNAGEWILTGN
jgi:hypothetical protein